MFNNEGGNLSQEVNNYNNIEKLSEKTSEHKYTYFYGQQSEVNNDINLNTIPKNQSQPEIVFTLEDNKNNHYICKECNSFPLIKIIKDEPTIILLLTCENHKEEIELSKYINRILNKDIDLYYNQYCKIHNTNDNKTEIFLKACLECKMDLCSKCLESHDKKHRIIQLVELKSESDKMIYNLKNYFRYKYNVTKKEDISIKDKSDKNDKSEGFKPETGKQQKTESDFGVLEELKDLIFTIASDSQTCKSYIHYENIKYFNYYLGEKLELEYYSYENESETKIRLFGEQFIKNNKDNCSLLINGEFLPLCEFYTIPDVDTHLNITLIKEKEITDMSYMFYDCYILSSIKNTSKWTTDNVTNMSYMFYNCQALVYLPTNFSNWNISNVTDMSYMFYDCKSLPDFANLKMLNISNWKPIKVKDMSYMFYGCENFDDLSNIVWDAGLLENMSNMFSECLGLVKLNIFKWKINNITDMSYMFYRCLSLQTLVDEKDADNWKTNKVTNMSNMFYECEDLKQLPEFISKWDTSQVQYMNYMFCNCKSLESLPEGIKNWNTENVLHMNNMFENCKKLEKLPDITNWKTEKLVDINNMYEGCDSLKDEDIPIFKNFDKIAYKQGKKFEKFLKKDD